MKRTKSKVNAAGIWQWWRDNFLSQPFDIGAEANEAFNTLNENRNCKNVMLYNIITQTTKTLQTRY